MIAKLTATAPEIETFTLIEGETENVLSSFPMYKQEGKYWCMPACAQMMIKYLTGTKVPQSTLANQLDIDDSSGGFFGNMKGVLNSYQSQNPYVLLYKENVTVETMSYQFSTALHWHDAPAAVTTKPFMDDGFPYDMNYYHALAITGEYYDRSGFRIHDPSTNASYVPYWVPDDGIFEELNSYIY